MMINICFWWWTHGYPFHLISTTENCYILASSPLGILSSLAGQSALYGLTCHVVMVIFVAIQKILCPVRIPNFLSLFGRSIWERWLPAHEDREPGGESTCIVYAYRFAFTRTHTIKKHISIWDIKNIYRLHIFFGGWIWHSIHICRSPFGVWIGSSSSSSFLRWHVSKDWARSGSHHVSCAPASLRRNF